MNYNHFINKDKATKQIIKKLQQKINLSLSIKCQICSSSVTTNNSYKINQKYQPNNKLFICPQPSCNQFICQSCLNKYYDQIKQQCPFCQTNIQKSYFKQYQFKNIGNHLKQQVLKYLKQVKFIQEKKNGFQIYEVEGEKFTMNKKQKTKNQRKNLNNYPSFQDFDHTQICLQHELPYRYYCQTCSCPICSDCGMLTPAHIGHKFSHLSSILQKIKQKLSIQLNRLTNKIFQSQQTSLKIKKKLHRLQIDHINIKKSMEDFYLLLVQKFQQEISSKTSSMKQIQEKNQKQIQFYQSCRDNICEEIERKTKNQLINECDKLAMSFAMVVCQPPELILLQDNFQTVKQLIPQYNNFFYVLNNFSLNTGGIVYSQPYLLNGSEWRLKIYPKGNGVAKGKYLSVFVQMTKAQTNQKKYQYKIQLINKDPQTQPIKRQYCSTFDIGQCWGYNQFILLQQLQSNGFLIQDDKLTFVMGIRSPDYRSLANDQVGYIKLLQSKIKLKELEKMVEEKQRQNCVQDQEQGNIRQNININGIGDRLRIQRKERIYRQSIRQSVREEQIQRQRQRIQQRQWDQFNVNNFQKSQKDEQSIILGLNLSNYTKNQYQKFPADILNQYNERKYYQSQNQSFNSQRFQIEQKKDNSSIKYKQKYYQKVQKKIQKKQLRIKQQQKQIKKQRNSSDNVNNQTKIKKQIKLLNIVKKKTQTNDKKNNQNNYKLQKQLEYISQKKFDLQKQNKQKINYNVEQKYHSMNNNLKREQNNLQPKQKFSINLNNFIQKQNLYSMNCQNVSQNSLSKEKTKSNSKEYQTIKKQKQKCTIERIERLNYQSQQIQKSSLNYNQIQLLKKNQIFKQNLSINEEFKFNLNQQQSLQQQKQILRQKQKQQANINSALKQKKYLISKKDMIKKSLSSIKINNNNKRNSISNEQEQKIQNRILNILQQSKKTQVINTKDYKNQRKNNLILDNQSQIIAFDSKQGNSKLIGMNSSIGTLIKSTGKNGYLRIQNIRRQIQKSKSKQKQKQTSRQKNKHK